MPKIGNLSAQGVKISLKVEYACRVMAQLALRKDEPELPHIECLATAEEVPANYLVQILNELRNAGLINSRRGKQGGYSLARDPEQITLADIIRAIDGELLAFTASERGASGQRVAHAWSKLAKDFDDAASAITVQDFTEAPAEGMWFI